MIDSLGNRMKDFYENRTRYLLPRRTYTVIRIDGKAFHTYTKGLKRPFDELFMEDMNETAKYLCANIQGCKLGFVQSDEISLVLTDFDNLQTDAYFNGNIQKITSISASITTAKFNELRNQRFVSQNGGFMKPPKLAMFDSRVFTIPSKMEVINYLIWRQQDATRNSILTLAQSLFSHKEIQGKNMSVLQDKMFTEKGVNWNDLETDKKRGRLIIKKTYVKENTERSRWVVTDTPIFTQDKELLEQILPNL